MQLLLALLFLALAYLLFWPTELEPEARELPPPPELTGPYAPNDRLTEAELLELPDGRSGPEDIAVLDGVIYTTDIKGGLYRLAEDDTFELVAELGGRPLGLTEGQDGSLYIADSYRGITRWSPEGRLDVLADRAGGEPITYANQIEVDADGVVYFTNSTSRHDP